MSFARRAAPGVLLVIVLLVSWEALRLLGPVDRRLLPSGIAIGGALAELAVTRVFWNDLGYTLLRAFAGLGLAVAVGVPAGLAVGSSRAVAAVGTPLIDFWRSVPVTTLYPVVVLTLGIGDRGKVGMVFVACVFVMALHAAAGVGQRSLVRHHTASLYGAGSGWLLRHVSFYEALPTVLTGLRVSVGLALIVSTLTEMFMGSGNGIGQKLMEAYSVYALAVMYAYILALGFVGFALNRLFATAEARSHAWTAA